jgi:hypothetical protein
MRRKKKGAKSKQKTNPKKHKTHNEQAPREKTK